MYHPVYCPPTPSLFHLTIRIKLVLAKNHVKVFLSCDWYGRAGIPPGTAILSALSVTRSFHRKRH